MRANQRGFTAVEAILLLVVVGLIGGTGWYVWTQRTGKAQGNQPSSNTQTSEQTNNQQSTKAADETASWTLFTSSKGWQLRIPDGWELYTDMNSESLTSYASTLVYQKGVPGKVTKTEGGRDGTFVFSVTQPEDGKPVTPLAYLNLTNVSDFKVKNITGKKYYGTLLEDANMDGNKGDTNYWYEFTANGKTVIFRHYQASGKTSVVDVLEKAISTFQFKM
jgi:type II secretory pathway pseudopilin PulG